MVKKNRHRAGREKQERIALNKKIQSN